MSANQVRRQQGGRWCPAPHLKSVLHHFRFGPPVAAYIQYCILKMWPPLLFFGPSFWFLAPLLLHPGDGSAANFAKPTPNVKMTSYCDVKNSVYLVKLTTIHHSTAQY